MFLNFAESWILQLNKIFAGNRYTYHLFPESLDVVVKSIESEEYEEDFFRGYNW